MEPNFITHYYLKGSEPFLNISELDEAEWFSLEKKLRKRLEVDESYNRRFGVRYRSVRLEIEEKIREMFVEKGGKPERNAPHYFCLGECAWWKGFCSHNELRVELEKIDPDKISFTYPDSFTSSGLLERFGIIHEIKPYHGEVFTLSEIHEVIGQYGMPNGDYTADYKAYHKEELELYVEAQLWSDEPVKEYLSKCQPVAGGDAAR